MEQHARRVWRLGRSRLQEPRFARGFLLCAKSRDARLVNAECHALPFGVIDAVRECRELGVVIRTDDLYGYAELTADLKPIALWSKRRSIAAELRAQIKICYAPNDSHS